MPCYDDRSSYSSMRDDTEFTDELQERLDLATRVACELNNNLVRSANTKLSKETEVWIAEHEAFDKKRKKKKTK